MRLTSSDLELTFDRSQQTVGMRFNGIGIPKGANITNAYIQFQADEAQSGVTSLTIQGEDIDNAPTFIPIDGNISFRLTTTASMSWSPDPWLAAGDAGVAQQTPDIASVIQEIVDRPNWGSGNSIVIIITGEGQRKAESFDGLASAAPTLHIEYTTAPHVLAEIIVTPDPARVVVNGKQQFTATGYDEYGNVMDISPAWSTNGGGIIDSTGMFTAGTETGPFTVKASQDLIEGTADGTVTEPPVLAEIIVTPDPALVEVNETQQFTATGYDQYGYAMEIFPAWSTSGGGTIDSTGLFMAGTEVGPFTVTAVDGIVSGSATVNITRATTSISIPVAGSSDDAEEKPSGSMKLTSSDLEMTFDAYQQTVGMRFNGIGIPQGATITNAYIQFQADEAHAGVTSLLIQGENIDNAPTFIPIDGNISSRLMTTASVPWSPDPWLAAGDAGLVQQTPDIATIIQEIVNNLNWMSGNSIVIIVTGEGKRTAESYDGTAAPVLHVAYSVN
jgi:hypothetical protein